MKPIGNDAIGIVSNGSYAAALNSGNESSCLNHPRQSLFITDEPKFMYQDWSDHHAEAEKQSIRPERHSQRFLRQRGWPQASLTNNAP